MLFCAIISSRIEPTRAAGAFLKWWDTGVKAPRVFPIQAGAGYALSLLFLVAVYYFAGKLGLSLAFVHASASAVWPPTGIALAALLIGGARLWPAIFVGAFLVNFTTTPFVFPSLGIAAGNTLEALIGAALVNRLAQGIHAFERVRNVFTFIFAAALLSTAASATMGVSSLCLGGLAPWEQFPVIWFTWWLGDVVSNMVIAPFILVWLQKPAPPRNGKAILEAAAILGVLLLVLALLFVDPLELGSANPPLGFLALPPLIWAAFRFGPHGAVTASLLASCVAIWRTLEGVGPFHTSNPNESLLLLQAFIGVNNATALILAAVLRERQRAEEALREDIEARKRGEQALRESENRKTAILSAALDAIITMDHRGCVVDLNPAFEQIFGFQRDKIIGKPLADFIVPERLRQQHNAGLGRYLATGKAPVLDRRIEMPAFHADGHEFPVELSIARVADTEPPLFTGTLRDISERKQTEERLERIVAERTAQLREIITELEHYSYSISHDMRSPLRAMQAYAHILVEEVGPRLDETNRKYLERIMAAANRLDKLITDVLAYSRISRAEIDCRPVSLDRMVEEITYQYPALQNARIEINGTLGSVIGAEALLSQAIANLLANAAKFVPQGRKPAIRVWAEPSEFSGKPAVKLLIQDNGIGIAPENHQRIFGIFTRLHRENEYEGTGIGLSVVKRAIERMGGRVGLESELGKGSTFWIELPKA